MSLGISQPCPSRSSDSARRQVVLRRLRWAVHFRTYNGSLGGFIQKQIWKRPNMKEIKYAARLAQAGAWKRPLRASQNPGTSLTHRSAAENPLIACREMVEGVRWENHWGTWVLSSHVCWNPRAKHTYVYNIIYIYIHMHIHIYIYMLPPSEKSTFLWVWKGLKIPAVLEWW